MDLQHTTKRCGRCKCIALLSDFTKNRRNKDGLGTSCRACLRIEAKASYQKHRASRLARMKVAAAKNKDKIASYQRAYRAQHPDRYLKRRAYYRRHYQTHKPEIRAYQRQYQTQNPQRAAIRTMRHYARKLQSGGSYTLEQWQAMCVWFGAVCLSCATSGKLEQDHVIPLARGGPNTIANIQPLCRSCNASKGTSAIDYREPIRLAAFLETV